MTEERRPKIAEVTHRPVGSWWSRLVEAIRIAIENRRFRKEEGRDGDWYEDLETLKTEDDKKGDRTT